MSLRAIDLFCGAGGATLGMLRAGLDVVAGVERDPATALVYGRLTGVEPLVSDVDTLRPGDVPRFDLAWASPPCQPYSRAGKRKGRYDGRDGIGVLMAFVERFRPTRLVVEEVPMFKSFPSADYGVPQIRRRLFVLARRDGWLWPAPVPPPMARAVVSGR